jgi:hypothetical protein
VGSGSGGSASRAPMQAAICPRRLRETSSTMPGSVGAPLPARVSSVTMSTSAPAPRSPTVTVITARADPEPPASYPSASSTAVRAESSRKTTLPVAW